MRTTLNKIYACHPECKRGWNALLNYTGKSAPDDDPLSFNTILDAIGLFPAIWCIRSIEGCDDIKQQFHDFCLSGRSKEEMEIKFLELFGD